MHDSFNKILELIYKDSKILRENIRIYFRRITDSYLLVHLEMG